jgi:peptidoglycan/xylan/chitin deacetylase (PgdA/CDA1 family)
MRQQTRIVRRAVTAVCIATALLAAPAGPGAQAPPPRIALTFDDLPVHAALPPGLTRVQVAKSIVDALVKGGVPEAYGFINAAAIEKDASLAEVLRLWRAAGFPLGNHAYSHMDLHANSAEAFARDVVANEAILRAHMGGQEWKWFRYPFLREGDTPAKYGAVRAMLASRGYRVAQVTISFDDYAYNDPYARCAAQGDRHAIAWLERSYMDRAAESLTRGQDAARRLFGRDISHVMLLHVGAFQTVMLPRLLDLLADRRFRIVTLAEAQADEAYSRTVQRPGPRAGTFLDQLETTRPARDPAAPNVFAQLSALCTGSAR